MARTSVSMASSAPRQSSSISSDAIVRLARPIAEPRHEIVEGALGVAEEHARVLVQEERVVDTGVAGGHPAFEHDDPPRLPRLEHRHAVDRAALVLEGARIDDVVGADYEHHVG